MTTSNKPINIIIIGASLDTGNLGVSALLASTIGWIYKVCPNPQIKLFDGVAQPTEQVVTLDNGINVHLDRVGIRINKTLWRKNHLLRLLFEALISRGLPPSIRKNWLDRNPYMRELMASHVVFDITGGDSFTDIYGSLRFIHGCLRKLLVIFCGLNFILLPQTYGPFKNKWTKILARFICKHTKIIYSRDEQGIGEISTLMQEKSNRPLFCPDVAFGLNPYEPKKISTIPPFPEININSTLVGFNISGLLYYGGYNQDNMFKLKSNYKECVISLIHSLLIQNNVSLILIPHVFPQKGWETESDPMACTAIYKKFSGMFPDKIFLLEGDYDQSEIKWIIGKCDFLIGSRMHACIAAASQGIPAVALAYSKKFRGVFRSIDLDDHIIDLRFKTIGEAENTILKLLANRKSTSKKLLDQTGKCREILLKSFSNIFKEI